MKKDLNLLVCGGAGYIGSAFVHHLKTHTSHSVVVLDTLQNGCFIDKEVPFYQTNVGNFQEVCRILRDHKIDVVFHFCAFLEVGESVQDPLKYYQNNISNSISLL